MKHGDDARAARLEHARRLRAEASRENDPERRKRLSDEAAEAEGFSLSGAGHPRLTAARRSG